MRGSSLTLIFVCFALASLDKVAGVGDKVQKQLLGLLKSKRCKKQGARVQRASFEQDRVSDPAGHVEQQAMCESSRGTWLFAPLLSTF